ncbi:MAG: adenylate kinase [Tunicatimonas sp.]
MLNLVLFGPPGAGKGTQSQKLIDHYQLTHISTGDLFRKHLGEGTPLGIRARTFMDVGKLVPDDLVIDMVDDRLGEQDDTKGIIFDGFPRTIPQAEALDKFLRTYDSHIAGMIALSVPTEELVKRLLLRGQTSGRADDQNEEKIATRLDVYRQETLPVARYYQDQNKYAEVDGVGDIDTIFKNIVDTVDGWRD